MEEKKMKNSKGFIAGMLTMLLLVCLIGSVSATRGVVQKDIEYRDIKVSLDGKILDLKDAKGNTVEPFMFGGTNYIPARALAEALGLKVAWNSAEATVVLTSPGSSGQTAPSSSPAPSQGAQNPTIGEKNALASAKSYLNISAFSYKGLIEQLEYEKYTHAEAVYAADNCGANWNEQAVKSAASYLKISSFSREGLIAQLEYEGFTHEQAVYGAEQNGY
jgi:hypothetical protein